MIPKETLKQKFVAIQSHIYKIEGELILLKQRLMYFESLLDDDTVASLNAPQPAQHIMQEEPVQSSAEVTMPIDIAGDSSAIGAEEPETVNAPGMIEESTMEPVMEFQEELVEFEPEEHVISSAPEIYEPVLSMPEMGTVEVEEVPAFLAAIDEEAPLPFYSGEETEQMDVPEEVTMTAEEPLPAGFIPPEERQILMPFVAPVAAENPAVNAVTAETVEEVIAVATPVAENLNERLAKLKTGKDVSESFVGQPLADMKTAINLNLKLGFIRKLFGEDVIAYSAAIEKLNTCGSRETALAILRQKAQEYAWSAEEAELAAELETLVNRRWS